MNSKCFAFISPTLDSAGVLWLLTKQLGKVPEYKVTTISNLEIELSKADLEDYARVFFINLKILKSDEALISKLPKTSVLIDHWDELLPTTKLGFKAIPSEIKAINGYGESSTKAFYGYFEENYTKEEKTLIALINDYETYKLQTPLSVDLNHLFWSIPGDRVKYFIESFKDGFRGFTDNQKKRIELYKHEIEQIKQDVDLATYVWEGKIDNNTYEVICTFGEKSTGLNEVLHYLLNKQGSDIAVFANLKTKTVSVRASKDSKIPASEFIKIISETGNGGKYAASGALGDKFIKFSKEAKKI